MAGETIVTVIGNATGDAEVRMTKGGKPFLTFNLAETPRIFDRSSNEWKDGGTSFYSVSYFGPNVEYAASEILRGRRMIVHGVQAVRKFERSDGSTGNQVQITAQEIGPSLKFAPKGANGNGFQQQAPQAQPQAQGAPAGGQQQPTYADPFAANQDQPPSGW